MNAGAYLKAGCTLPSRSDAGYRRCSWESGLLVRFAQASSVNVRSRHVCCERLAMSTQRSDSVLERFRTRGEAVDTSTYEGSMGSERRLSRCQAGGGVGLTGNVGKDGAPSLTQQ